MNNYSYWKATADGKITIVYDGIITLDDGILVTTAGGKTQLNKITTVDQITTAYGITTVDRMTMVDRKSTNYGKTTVVGISATG